MQVIGTVKEIWRYPVKSMAGERLQRANVGALGIHGDRGWAIRDEKAGEIRNARKLPALSALRGCVSARAVRERRAARANHDAQWDDISLRLRRSQCATLRTPGTTRFDLAVQPPSERDFLRRAAPDNPDMTAEMREVFGRLENEPLPDLSTLPPQILEFTSPFGTFFDAFPFHAADHRVVERARQAQSHR